MFVEIDVSIVVVGLKNLLHVGFLPGQSKVIDAELIFISLFRIKSTSLSISSLLSTMRASLVLHRIEFVRDAPANDRKVQIPRSLTKVILFCL